MRRKSLQEKSDAYIAKIKTWKAEFDKMDINHDKKLSFKELYSGTRSSASIGKYLSNYACLLSYAAWKKYDIGSKGAAKGRV